MPFTPAHIAAVLPLRNRWNLIWSALIVGSIAPDFEYFLTLGPRTHRLHEFPQVVYLTLPAAFIVLWVVQKFLRAPVLEFLPTGIEERMDPKPFRFLGTRRLALIFLSLAIGIATHIAWDSFTHEDTMVTEHLSVEHRRVSLPVVGPKTVYKVLQWASSVAGLGLIGAYFWFWYTRTPPRRRIVPNHSKAAKFALWTLLTAAALAFSLRHTYVLFGGYPMVREMFVIALVTTMAALFWEVLAFSVFLQARRQWMMNSRTDVSARSTL